MDTPQKQGELRPQLHKIVTRDGKSHRIPEILEAELDDLEVLFSTILRQVEADVIGEDEEDIFDPTNARDSLRYEQRQALARLRERWGSL